MLFEKTTPSLLLLHRKQHYGKYCPSNSTPNGTIGKYMLFKIGTMVCSRETFRQPYKRVVCKEAQKVIGILKCLPVGIKGPQISSIKLENHFYIFTLFSDFC